MLKSLTAALTLALALPATAETVAETFAREASGSWTSVEQAESPDYDWVESEIVRIWPERTDGVWLYQENAIMGADAATPSETGGKATPYFQVVIRVEDMGGGRLYTTTYKVADRSAARGAWATPDTFQDSWLGEPSCPGELQRIGEGFWQGHAACPNAYKGSVRVESRSVRAPGVYVNWDRGLAADGSHVWGPRGGGYIFKRKPNGETPE